MKKELLLIMMKVKEMKVKEINKEIKEEKIKMGNVIV